jgi:hydrogenase nickel incorporation protein HypB
MCVVCGCGTKPAKRADKLPETALSYRQVQPEGGMQHGHHGHQHVDGHVHEHGQGHSHAHRHADPDSAGHPPATQEHVAVDAATGDLHFGHGAACVSVPGLSQARMVRLEQDILGKNNRFAEDNRAHFASHGVLALNLVSSPGSGKTTLLCATIEALRARADPTPVAVIEGDQQTSNDAERIRATGAPAIQVNTGKGCHLDAQMVGNAFARLPLHDHQGEADVHHHHPDRPGGILFIENVGNLVCPAMWDLGEAAKVVILSVTEGEDKPLKYPDMFAAARLMILNKTDLLPYLRFDVAQCIAYARRVNPQIEVLQLSATSGHGMDAWLDWIVGEHPATVVPTQALA